MFVLLESRINMIIEHISVSRKSLWDECQQKYKYRYHLKLDPIEKTPFYFTYGKIIHKIAEKYTSGNGEITLKEVTQKVLGGEIPFDTSPDGPVYAPNIPKDYKKRMVGHLKSLQTITDQVGFAGETEYGFHYDLDPPNGKFVKGFIDRIIPKKDIYLILDYKTSKKSRWRKTRATVRSDLQLMTYARVIQKRYNIPAKKIYAGLYYLEGGDFIGANFSEKTLASVDDILISVYNRIENMNENTVMGNVGDHCRRCDYRKICPFYRVV